MRPIIDNTLQTIYAKNDHYISQLSKTNTKIAANATNIPIINASGFKADDFVIIENIGDERAEITQVNSILGNTLYVNTLVFDHENKINISRATYNMVNFYEKNTIITSIAIQPDYYTGIDHAVSYENEYAISFYNSETTKESPKGETITGYDNLLCSIGDLAKYEDVSTFSGKIIDKIDLASIEIRNKFTAQEQAINDLTNRELLRLPTALLALYYTFNELIKVKDDMPSHKAIKYKQAYDDKLIEVSQVINKTDDNVKFFGQSSISR